METLCFSFGPRMEINSTPSCPHNLGEAVTSRSNQLVLLQRWPQGGVEKLCVGKGRGLENEARTVVKAHELRLYPEDGRETFGEFKQRGDKMQGLGYWQRTRR